MTNATSTAAIRTIATDIRNEDLTMFHTLNAAMTKATNGRFLTITFSKRDGSTRKINGRIGVHFKGKPASHRMDAHDGTAYLLIWSVKDRGYRRVALATIKRIAADGVILYDTDDAKTKAVAIKA